MTIEDNKSILRSIIVVIALGWLSSNNASALSCVTPNLDTSFEEADFVSIGRLVAASMLDNISARSELILDNALKGNAPETLSIVTDIATLSSCGPVLTIGQSYLVFFSDDKTLLVKVHSDTYRWLQEKMQTTSSK